ncbi:MAG: PKD domain-containing protein [Gemmatimonadaceae bacterium]|nr:PKD domain-containing protein [Gemmatimonadaceae bacterium]
MARRAIRALRRIVLLPALLLGACVERTPTQPGSTGPVAPPDVSTATLNVAPGALFAVSPRYPAPGDTVTVDGSYSYDGDGQVVQYRWSFGNGVTTSTGATSRTVYRAAGTYPLSLTVIDDAGDSSTTTLSFTVGSGGTPATAISGSASTLVISAASVTAGTGVTATVTAKSADGTVRSGVPVAVSALGHNISATPATATTDGSGVATAVVSSAVAQASTVRAVADFTALTTTRALTITPAAVSAARSTMRLTQSSLTALTDTAIVEVTVRDTAGNVAPGVAVSLASSVAGLTMPAASLTDADGRWRGVVRMTALCGGTAATLTATAGGVPLATTVAVTGTATASYGVCGAALWLDAADLSTLTLDGSNRVSQWRDRSGNARHAANATLAEQPTAVAGALHGLRTVRYTTAALLRSQGVLQGITDAAEVFVVASATASQTGDTFLFGADSQFVVHPNERFSVHLPWANGNVAWDFGTCCAVPGARIGINYAAAGVALAAAQWSVGTMTGSTPERHIRRNGTTLVSDTGTDTLGFADQALRIGNSWGGDIAELLVFPRALTAPERAAVENGLMAKWSLGTLALTAGNSQSTAAGTSPATAPQVRVTNAAGTGVSGATVTFTVTSGGGRVNAALTATVTTDGSGYASAPDWVLDVGSNQLTASHGGQGVVFTGTGTLPTGMSLRLDMADSSNIFTGSGCTGAVSNGSSVGCVRDKSGNAYHALQATAGARATFSTSAQNGRSSLSFNLASDQYLIVNAAAIRSLRSTSRTVFAVARCTATTDNATNNGGAIVNWVGFNTGLHLSGYPVPTWVSSDTWENPGTGGAASFVGTWLDASASIVVTNTLAVTGSTFDSTIWRDGGNSNSSGAVAGTMTGAADLYVGIASPGTGGYNWRLNGRISEVIIYPRVVTTAERQEVERYLGWKWGISVP